MQNTLDPSKWTVAAGVNIAAEPAKHIMLHDFRTESDGPLVHILERSAEDSADIEVIFNNMTHKFNIKESVAFKACEDYDWQTLQYRDNRNSSTANGMFTIGFRSTNYR